MVKPYFLGFLLAFHFFHVSGVDLQTGLIGLWRFEGDLLDSSTNGFHGTAVNSPGFRPGLEGQALSATNDNGTKRYVNVGRSSALTAISNQFTMAFWIYYNRTNGGTRSGLMNRMASASTNHVWNLDITESTSGTTANTLRFSIYTNSSGAGPSGTSSVSFPSNAWVHVACVLDGSNAVVWTNGVTNLSFTVTGRMTMNNIADLVIGNRGDSTGYVLYGAMDEVCLYNRALSHLEVQTLKETRSGLYLGVNSVTNGSILFGNGSIQGYHGAPLGGMVETRVFLTNALGAEVVRQTVSTDAAGNWSMTLPALTSTATYTAVFVATNTQGLAFSSAPIGFTWYSSSNISLTISSRNGAGTPWSGGRMVGPASLTAWDGLRTNDAAGQVTYRGLWSGRSIAVTNLTPERWGQSALVTNLAVPDADGTVVWVFEGVTNGSDSASGAVTNKGFYSGQTVSPFVMVMDLGRKAGARVTIQAVPLAGGRKSILFDQIVSGSGPVGVEIPASVMKASLAQGIWLLEAKITLAGEDEMAAEKRRTLLFYYR